MPQLHRGMGPGLNKIRINLSPIFQDPSTLITFVKAFKQAACVYSEGLSLLRTLWYLTQICVTGTLMDPEGLYDEDTVTPDNLQKWVSSPGVLWTPDHDPGKGWLHFRDFQCWCLLDPAAMLISSKDHYTDWAQRIDQCYTKDWPQYPLLH